MKLLLIIIKGITLLIGIAMLVGGGLCSISVVFLGFSQIPMHLTDIGGLIILLLIPVISTFIGYDFIRSTFTDKK